MENQNLYKYIGSRIKKIRKNKKVDQVYLSNKINLSRSSISNIETGKHQPSILIIYKIAHALDVKITDLLPSVESYKSSKYIEDKYQTAIIDAKKEIKDDLYKTLKHIEKKLLSDE